MNLFLQEQVPPIKDASDSQFDLLASESVSLPQVSLLKLMEPLWSVTVQVTHFVQDENESAIPIKATKEKILRVFFISFHDFVFRNDSSYLAIAHTIYPKVLNGYLLITECGYYSISKTEDIPWPWPL